MIKKSRWAEGLVAGLILIGGLLPLEIYALVLGSIPTLMPAEALRQLNAQPGDALLVDVRPPEEFAKKQVEGALNYPLETVLGWSAAAQIPEPLRGKTLLLLCDGGWSSAQAARHLLAHGTGGVYNVRGGMQEWAKAAWRAPELKYTRFTGAGLAPVLPVVSPPRIEQAVQVLAGFVIKPLYMLASLVLALFLFQEPAEDLRALRRGLLAFFTGEAFCYVNFLVFRDDSYLSEFLHSYGMVVGFGLILYALLLGIDRRLLHYNNLDKRCGLMPLCLSCSRYRSIVCRARRAYQLLIPVFALLAVIPLLARFHWDGITGLVFGTQYYYARFGVYQAYENRVLPLMALACFALAYLPLWHRRITPAVSQWTQIFCAAGLGALSFSLIRLSLGTMYAANLVWFDFWEETTELVFVVAIGAVLWLFREALFPKGVFRQAAKLFSNL